MSAQQQPQYDYGNRACVRAGELPGVTEQMYLDDVYADPTRQGICDYEWYTLRCSLTGMASNEIAEHVRLFLGARDMVRRLPDGVRWSRCAWAVNPVLYYMRLLFLKRLDADSETGMVACADEPGLSVDDMSNDRWQHRVDELFGLDCGYDLAERERVCRVIEGDSAYWARDDVRLYIWLHGDLFKQLMEECQTVLWLYSRVACRRPPSKIVLPPWYWMVCNHPGGTYVVDFWSCGRLRVDQFAMYLVACPDYRATVIAGKVAIWDRRRKRYIIGDEGVTHEVMAICREISFEAMGHYVPSDEQVKQVLKAIRSSVPPGDYYQKSDPMLVAVENGVVDMRRLMDGDDKGCLIENRPEYRIENVLHVRYVPDAHSELLEQVLWQLACGVGTRFENMLEAFAVCIYRSPLFQVVPLFYGENGSDGKSFALQLLEGILGEDNYSSVAVDYFDDKFVAQSLVGMLANINGEMPSVELEGAALRTLKMISGGDAMEMSRKHKNSTIKTTLYTTIMLACNTLPHFKQGDVNGGTLRRFKLIVPFEGHFSDEDGSADMQLLDKLSADEAREALLVMVLQRLARMLRNVEARRAVFTDSGESRELLRRIRLENDAVALFVDELGVDASWLTCEVPREAIISVLGGRYADDDVYDEYVRHTLPYVVTWNMFVRYCDANHVPNGHSSTSFLNRLKPMLGVARGKAVRDKRFGRVHRAFYRVEAGEDSYDAETPSWK